MVTFNQSILCRSVAMGYQAIKVEDASVVVCGGQENMSCAPHTVHMRNATKMGSATLVDTMVLDGLTDAFHDCHMGITGKVMFVITFTIQPYLFLCLFLGTILLGSTKQSI